MPDSIIQTISREELHRLVWTTPGRTLATRFGISDVGLAKVCKKFGIPRPGLGHWAKAAVGKAPRKKALPPVREGLPNVIEFRIEQAPIEEPIALPPDIVEAIARVRAFAASDISAKPHPLVARLRQSWNGRPHVPPRGSLSIHWISPARSEDALRSLNLLVRGLATVGGEFETSEGRNVDLTVSVLGVALAIRMREPNHREDHVFTPEESRRKAMGQYVDDRCEWRPSGLLEIEAFDANETRYPSAILRWRETATRKMPERIHGITESLLRCIASMRATDARRRREAEERHRQQVAELKEQQRRAEEKERVDRLLTEVEQWRTANEIREYVRTVCEYWRARHGCEIQQGSEADEWRRWASDVADRYDPLQPPVKPVGMDDRDPAARR